MAKMNTDKSKNFLLYMQVIPFCFWALDVTTTLYAINFLGVAAEMNPLGWPWGAWGALVFYVPALVFTYLLLFRIHKRFSFWSAVVITLLTLGLGALNLLAALHNIQIALAFL